MDQQHIQEFKKALEDEHERLVTQLRSVAKQDPARKDNWDATYPQFEQGESGSHSSEEQEQDEVEEYEMRLGVEHSLESRLLNVTRALHRITENTYGICPKCKKEIDLDRLRANPSAEFHIEHTA